MPGSTAVSPSKYSVKISCSFVTTQRGCAANLYCVLAPSTELQGRHGECQACIPSPVGPPLLSSPLPSCLPLPSSLLSPSWNDEYYQQATPCLPGPAQTPALPAPQLGDVLTRPDRAMPWDSSPYRQPPHCSRLLGSQGWVACPGPVGLCGGFRPVGQDRTWALSACRNGPLCYFLWTTQP